MENIQMKIRDWIVKENETTGGFPDIPDEESGGCRFLFFPDENSEAKEEAETKEVKKDPKAKDDGEVEGKKNGPLLIIIIIKAIFSAYPRPYPICLASG